MLKQLRILLQGAPCDDSSFVQHSPKCWMLQSYKLKHIKSELRIGLLLSRMIAMLSLLGQIRENDA